MAKNTGPGRRSGTPATRTQQWHDDHGLLGYHPSVVGLGPFGGTDFSDAELAMLRRMRERDEERRREWDAMSLWERLCARARGQRPPRALW